MEVRAFLRSHYGIDVTTDEALQELLKNEKLRALVQESMSTSRSEMVKMGYFQHGFNASDDYWKNREIRRPEIKHKIPDKRIPGLAYDSEGRRIPHVSLFRETAEAMQRANPNIVVKATRKGISIDYYLPLKKDCSPIQKIKLT